MKNLLFAWQLSFEYRTNLGEPLLNFLLHILNWWWERCQVPLIIIWNLVLISKIDSIKQYLEFNVENKLLTNFVTFKSPYQAHLKMGSLSVWIFRVVALSTISFCWIKRKKIKLISDGYSKSIAQVACSDRAHTKYFWNLNCPAHLNLQISLTIV